MNGISKCCLCLLLLLLVTFVLLLPPATGQQQQQQQASRVTDQQQPGNMPYYMQSPMSNAVPEQQQQAIFQVDQAQQQSQAAPPQGAEITQRTNIPSARIVQRPRQMQAPPSSGVQAPAAQEQQCMYDKRYFARIDHCLSRRPYPTIGLPAFKNEDLLIKVARGGNGAGFKNDPKRGCQFTLSNGLFKNYLISSYSIDSDTQCLDTNGKVAMSLEFSNATLYYLWQLRCLNYADQLLDDATLGGKLGDSLERELQQENSANSGGHARPRQLCVGSSQTFGFTSLQLGPIEAQLELATDIYKNWRVTNVTLAFARLLTPSSSSGTDTETSASSSQPLSSIRDFTFESLDGDELNWRYLQTFSNWSRNRLHTNFLEQFRRFVWISLQRCLSESGEKIANKAPDLFGNFKYT